MCTRERFSLPIPSPWATGGGHLQKEKHVSEGREGATQLFWDESKRDFFCERLRAYSSHSVPRDVGTVVSIVGESVVVSIFTATFSYVSSYTASVKVYIRYMPKHISHVLKCISCPCSRLNVQLFDNGFAPPHPFSQMNIRSCLIPLVGTASKKMKKSAK